MVFRSTLSCLLLSALAPIATPQAPSPGVPDPNGGWTSTIGELSVLSGGDTLAFSYSAVFGPTAHTCDGDGVARRVADGRWEVVDGDSTIAFVAAKDGLRVEVTADVAPFCGAGWDGDAFPVARHEPPMACTVKAERTFFYAIGSSPPERRKAYVVRGDRVETLPLRNEGAETFLLARFVAAKSTTVGLLLRADVGCPTP